MSNQILFKIRKSERHPIINVPAGENKNIKCMVDTGATIPVWCGSIDYLGWSFDPGPPLAGKTPAISNY